MLHIMSSADPVVLHTLLSVLTTEDAVAILEEVVTSQEASTIAERVSLKTKQTYIIGNQKKTNTEHTKGMELTGYQLLVNLCEQHTPIQTWY